MSKVETRLLRSEKLYRMVKEGIPYSLRQNVWMRISGAHEKRMKSDLTYKAVVKASSNDHLITPRHEKTTKRLLFLSLCALLCTFTLLTTDTSGYGGLCGHFIFGVILIIRNNLCG